MLVIDNGITPPIVEANLIAIGQSYKQTINYTNIMKGVGEIIKGVIRTSRWGKKQTEAGVGMIIDGIITTVDGAKNVKSFEGHLGQRSNSGLLLDGIKTVELKSNNVTSITMYSASALQTSGRKYWSSTARTVSGYHLSTLIPCGTRETDGGCYTTGAAAWMAGSVETPQIHQAFIDDVNSFYYLRGYNNFTNKGVGRLEKICSPFNLPLVPASNLINIDTSFTGPFQYSIINVIGQEVERGTYNFINFDLGTFNSQLNLMKSDIYILRLRDVNGRIKNINFFHQK